VFFEFTKFIKRLEFVKNFSSINLLSFDMYTWPTPESRSFAALSDLGLYAEVLQVASKEPISAAKLMSQDQGLRQRMRRLHLVQVPSKTNINGLVNALEAFGLLFEKSGSRGSYQLTEEGKKAAQESVSKPREFRRLLATKLQKRYVVPGWFVARLHSLNPQGQGEVLLPAPPKTAKAERRAWNNNDWPTEYDEMTIVASERANEIFPGSFPVPVDEWLFKVRQSWKQLGSGDPPLAGKKGSAIQKDKKATFAPRERLVHAMREAAVKLLFDIWDHQNFTKDFTTSKTPMSSRAFSVWCPRLDELEFIFYTDYHLSVTGRLIVPCGAFRFHAKSPPFELLNEVCDPQERSLWLYQPRWEDIGEQFLVVLQDTYRRISKQVGAMYVSLLDVRDEVCRQLRLSSNRFDYLIEIAYRETVRSSVSLSKSITISLESDITSGQKGAVGLNRRPVYINNIPHSLIALATTRKR
jgi:DNA-binding PadR family transcriptional regulator